MHVIPQKSFIMALNISHDALDLQNVAQIPKVSFTAGQSLFVALDCPSSCSSPYTLHYGMLF